MKLLIKFILCLGLTTHLAFGDEVRLFMTLSPAGSFEAVCKRIKAKVNKSKEKLTFKSVIVRIDGCKTGVDLRDTHFKKHLNTSKVTLTDIKLSKNKGIGILSIGKIKKKVQFTYSLDKKNVNAEFEIKPSSFKLPRAQYLGVGVNDLVKVKVKFRI